MITDMLPFDKPAKWRASVGLTTRCVPRKQRRTCRRQSTFVGGADRSHNDPKKKITKMKLAIFATLAVAASAFSVPQQKDLTKVRL